MKRIIFLSFCIFTFLTFKTYAQSHPNKLPTEGISYKYVLLEEFTGSWCNNCPSTTLAIDSLLNNGLKIATIAYQIETAPDMLKYYIMANWDRSNFYDTIYSIPDVFINGNLNSNAVFGNAASKYNKYFPLYDSCIKSKTAYDLALNIEHKRYDDLALDSLFVEIHVEKVAQDSSKNLALHLAVTQNHIQKDWYNLTELNHVNRLMLPNADGIPLDFSQTNTHIQKYAFAIPDSANIPLKDITLVGFLQERTFLRYDTIIYSDDYMSITPVYNKQVHQTDMVEFTKRPIQIEKEPNQLNVSIYPNPSANGVFYLSNNEDISNCRVFDLFGKEIQNLNGNTQVIDLSAYAKGIYILQIKGKRGVQKTMKLLRQ